MSNIHNVSPYFIKMTQLSLSEDLGGTSKLLPSGMPTPELGAGHGE
jgi:hypothetical protein